VFLHSDEAAIRRSGGMELTLAAAEEFLEHIFGHNNGGGSMVDAIVHGNLHPGGWPHLSGRAISPM